MKSIQMREARKEVEEHKKNQQEENEKLQSQKLLDLSL